MTKAQIFKMPSGAELHVGVSEFEQASMLTQAVLKCLVGIKLSPEALAFDVEKLRENPASVMSLLDHAITFATSDAVRNCAFACMGDVKYAPKANAALIAVDKALFNDAEYGVQAREDYYTIIGRIVEVNCKPFLARVLSGLLAPKVRSTDTQQ